MKQVAEKKDEIFESEKRRCRECFRNSDFRRYFTGIRLF